MASTIVPASAQMYAERDMEKKIEAIIATSIARKSHR